MAGNQDGGNLPSPLLHVNINPLASSAFLQWTMGEHIHISTHQRWRHAHGAHFLFQLLPERSGKKKLVKTSFQLCLYKRKKESLNVEIIILHRTCRSFRGYYFDRCLFLGIFQANPPPWICCLLLSCPFLRCVNKQWRGRKQIFCQGNAGPFGNTCLKRHILNLWINCTFFICHPLQKKKKMRLLKKSF